MRNFLILLIVGAIGLFWVPSSDAVDIYEDASAYGYDLKQEQEDEVFFYESRFVDLGLHAGARTFTGGLGTLFGLGASFGGFLTYYFTRRFGLELTVNSSFHEFLIDGVSGHATLLDILARAKYYFVSDTYSKALMFANPHLFIGGGEFIRTKALDSVPTQTKDQGFGVELGGGMEVPLKGRQVFMGFQASYQMIFFGDENQKTEKTRIQLDGDAINLVGTLTYSF